MRRKILIMFIAIVANFAMISKVLSVEDAKICIGFQTERFAFHKGYSVNIAESPGISPSWEYIICCITTNNRSNACDFSLEYAQCKLYLSRNMESCGKFVPND